MALLHLGLALRHVRRSLNGTFAVLGALVAVECFSAPLRYLSATIPDAVLGLKISQGAILAYAGTLIWFTREFAGLGSRKIPMFISGLSAVAVVLHLALPFSSRFESITALRTAPLIGGGLMYVPVGKLHPLLWLGHLVGVLTVAYLLAACISLWRNRLQRSRALAFTLGIAPLVLFAYPHGVLVNRGLADPPHFYAVAFLGLIAIMSQTILSDIVRSFELSKEVQANERRWSTLLDKVSLLVLGCDRQGRVEYVNPCLIEKTGLDRSDLVGQSCDVLFPPDELPDLHQAFEAAINGRVSRMVQRGLLTKTKHRLTILWSNVLLYDSSGEITGILSVGTDMTERVAAEKARDEAIAELAALKNQLEAENQYLKLEYEDNPDFMDLIGESDAMRYVRHKINQVAGTNATVLIEGETGVGKELVARAIHQLSPRSNMPFVKVNCAALPPTLVESELFGHERGAFTGADRSRQGRFELAEGGTILLDEIGELPLDMQVKLLRVLQGGEFDRVGGSTTRKANVRVIASTNRHLQEEVSAGRFREDLYYRLQVFPITVPPLRERCEDIPLLVQHFVCKLCLKYGRPVPDIPVNLVKQLRDYDWPGNVRELENILERAIITNSKQYLTIPTGFASQRPSLENHMAAETMTLDVVERRHIELVLKRTRGQIAGEGGAAEILGLHPNTLRGRMAKLGVQRPN